MTAPQTILAQLSASGIGVRLADDGINLAVPAGRLSPQQRALVLTHKPELVAFLQAAHATTTELLTAAMRACDHHGDGQAAREQMRLECLETPLHLHADLLDHFRRTYGDESRP